jgi:hypothetical protein
MNFGRLADLVAQPASASERTAPQTPEAPAAPSAPATFVHGKAASSHDVALPVPPVPTAPAANMAPPVPPVPPAPPMSLRDGAAPLIPSEAEIRRMVPHVDVADGCEDGKSVTRRETVDADGRRHIRVRICQAQIEAQAHSAARAGLIAARAQIAAAMKMSDKVKADVLRDLDREIAHMDGED